jgi:hypothetical protein
LELYQEYVNPAFSFSYETELSIRIVDEPKHGELVQAYPESKISIKYNYKYTPDPDFVGEDTFVFEVEFEGIVAKVFYIMIMVGDGVPFSAIDENGDRFHVTDCPRESWIFTQPPVSDSDDLTSWIRSTSLFTLLTGATDAFTGFANLAGGALGSTTASQITLDTTATGHTCFIDYTPYLNEEWFPTSTPYEWQAKPGSEAKGKIDLLSVLPQEYAHVLGFEHSSDTHDFVAATLQAVWLGMSGSEAPGLSLDSGFRRNDDASKVCCPCGRFVPAWITDS